MILTTKSRYAVMAVLDIALYSNNNEKPINLHDISIRQNITLNYLEQIFSKLKIAGLVKSFKGPGGGYLLTLPFQDIKIKNIVDAVEENLVMTRCNNNSSGSCTGSNNAKCSTHYLWEGLSLSIQKYLIKITVADLLSGKVKEEVLNLRNIH